MPQDCLKQASVCSLRHYATALGLNGGPAAVISQFSDFLLSSVALKLRHFSDNLTCPMVLASMMELGNPDLISSVDPVIDEIIDGWL